MTPDNPVPRFTRSRHLVAMIGEAERLAALVRATPPAARAAHREDLLTEAALASLRLDGSLLEEVPTPVDGQVVSASAGVPRQGTWAEAMGMVGVAGEDKDTLQALEYAGVRAALDADDLAAPLLERPQQALVLLHRRLTRGLVPDERAGKPRTSRQAVSDRSTGRVIFFAPEPSQVPGRLAMLAGWLASAGSREHGVITSGIAHHELLVTHPYDAANGRMARAAARLVLRARDLDPDGLTAAEVVLAGDPLGYYEEVAATTRRRDLTLWLERWGEAVADGLRLAARSMGLLPASVPPRAQRFLDGLQDDRFTVADYRADATAQPDRARRDLRAMLDAGRISRVAGTRGLRFEVVPPA